MSTWQHRQKITVMCRWKSQRCLDIKKFISGDDVSEEENTVCFKYLISFRWEKNISFLLVNRALEITEK